MFLFFHEILVVAKKYALDEIGLFMGFYTSFDWRFTKKYVFGGRNVVKF